MGLAVGLSLSVMVLVWQNYREKQAASDAAAQPKPDPRAKVATASENEEGARSYDFYNMLPNFEVVIPEQEPDVKVDAAPVTVEKPGVYVLQAGSFSEYKDADRRRAELALHGIESVIQRVSIDDRTYHRVRIGPISDLDKLNLMRSRLHQANIDVIRIRLGD